MRIDSALRKLPQPMSRANARHGAEENSMQLGTRPRVRACGSRPVARPALNQPPRARQLPRRMRCSMNTGNGRCSNTPSSPRTSATAGTRIGCRTESAAAVARRKASYAEFRSRLAGIDAEQLPAQTRIVAASAALPPRSVRRSNKHYGTLPFGVYDAWAPVTQMDGIHLALPQYWRALPASIR